MSKKARQIEITEEQVIESYKAEHLKMDNLRRAQDGLKSNIAEISTVKEALKEIKQAKKGESIFLHLGAGFFAEAAIENNSKVKMNIGSNVVSETTIENALGSLEKMRAENEKNLELLQQELNTTLANLQNLGTLIVQAQRMRKQAPRP